MSASSDAFIEIDNLPEKLYTQTQLKHMLGGVSDMFIYRRRKEGVLPKPIVIGNRNYWKRSELLKFFETLEG